MTKRNKTNKNSFVKPVKPQNCIILHCKSAKIVFENNYLE